MLIVMEVKMLCGIVNTLNIINCGVKEGAGVVCPDPISKYQFRFIATV